MDAFTLMKKDHSKVKKIFKQLEKSSTPEEREKLFPELKKELEAHAYMEENAFYPAMREAKPTHTSALEAYEEHHIVKILLAELDELPKYQEEWPAKLYVLKENVEHHVKEEEKEMFPKAKKILGKKAKEVGEEMEKVKQYYLDQLPTI